METKHTPTPWALSDNGFGIYGPAPDEWGIAFLIIYEQRAVAQGQGISDEEQKANARLIVTAVNAFPALVAACEALVAHGAGRETYTDALLPIVEQARRALALAKGGV